MIPNHNFQFGSGFPHNQQENFSSVNSNSFGNMGNPPFAFNQFPLIQGSMVQKVPPKLFPNPNIQQLPYLTGVGQPFAGYDPQTKFHLEPASRFIPPNPFLPGGNVFVPQMNTRMLNPLQQSPLMSEHNTTIAPPPVLKKRSTDNSAWERISKRLLQEREEREGKIDRPEPKVYVEPKVEEVMPKFDVHNSGDNNPPIYGFQPPPQGLNFHPSYQNISIQPPMHNVINNRNGGFVHPRSLMGKRGTISSRTGQDFIEYAEDEEFVDDEESEYQMIEDDEEDEDEDEDEEFSSYRNTRNRSRNKRRGGRVGRINTRNRSVRSSRRRKKRGSTSRRGPGRRAKEDRNELGEDHHGRRTRKHQRDLRSNGSRRSGRRSQHQQHSDDEESEGDESDDGSENEEMNGEYPEGDFLFRVINNDSNEDDEDGNNNNNSKKYAPGSHPNNPIDINNYNNDGNSSSSSTNNKESSSVPFHKKILEGVDRQIYVPLYYPLSTRKEGRRNNDDDDDDEEERQQYYNRNSSSTTRNFNLVVNKDFHDLIRFQNEEEELNSTYYNVRNLGIRLLVESVTMFYDSLTYVDQELFRLSLEQQTRKRKSVIYHQNKIMSQHEFRKMFKNSRVKMVTEKAINSAIRSYFSYIVKEILEVYDVRFSRKQQQQQQQQQQQTENNNDNKEKEQEEQEKREQEQEQTIRNIIFDVSKRLQECSLTVNRRIKKNREQLSDVEVFDRVLYEKLKCGRGCDLYEFLNGLNINYEPSEDIEKENQRESKLLYDFQHDLIRGFFKGNETFFHKNQEFKEKQQQQQKEQKEEKDEKEEKEERKKWKENEFKKSRIREIVLNAIDSIDSKKGRDFDLFQFGKKRSSDESDEEEGEEGEDDEGAKEGKEEEKQQKGNTKIDNEEDHETEEEEEEEENRKEGKVMNPFDLMGKGIDDISVFESETSKFYRPKQFCASHRDQVKDIQSIFTDAKGIYYPPFYKSRKKRKRYHEYNSTSSSYGGNEDINYVEKEEKSKKVRKVSSNSNSGNNRRNGSKEPHFKEKKTYNTRSRKRRERD